MQVPQEMLEQVEVVVTVEEQEVPHLFQVLPEDLAVMAVAVEPQEENLFHCHQAGRWVLQVPVVVAQVRQMMVFQEQIL